MTAPDVRALVCTGRCNPSVLQLDALVHRYRESEHVANSAGPRLPIDDPALLEQLHALAHTPHARLWAGSTTWRCESCGAERRF